MDLGVYQEHTKGSLTQYGMHPLSIKREYGMLPFRFGNIYRARDEFKVLFGRLEDIS
jgi:hypothetical protein